VRVAAGYVFVSHRQLPATSILGPLRGYQMQGVLRVWSQPVRSATALQGWRRNDHNKSPLYCVFDAQRVPYSPVFFSVRVPVVACPLLRNDFVYISYETTVPVGEVTQVRAMKPVPYPSCAWRVQRGIRSYKGSGQASVSFVANQTKLEDTGCLVCYPISLRPCIVRCHEENRV
jgi:hypothetical protein